MRQLKKEKQQNTTGTTEYREAKKHVKQLLKRDKKDFLHQKLFDIESSQAKLKHKKMFEESTTSQRNLPLDFP